MKTPTKIPAVLRVSAPMGAFDLVCVAAVSALVGYIIGRFVI